MDWRDCPHVWIDPDRMSGAVCFRGGRLPVTTLFESLQHGQSVAEFMETYDPPPTREQIDGVFAYVLAWIEAARDTSLDRRYAGPPQDNRR